MSDSTESKIRRSDSEIIHYDKAAEEVLHGASWQEIIDINEFERYRLTKNPAHFPKEKMFSLVNQIEGKKVLEIGCGHGAASVRLAYVDKEVTAYDVSPKAIEVAKLVAEVNGMNVDFRVGDFTQDVMLGKEEFDIVWFEMVLHHMIPELDDVMSKTYNALKPGGLFVCWEPLDYPRWIRKLDPMWRMLGARMPNLSVDYSPEEHPLRPSELEIIRRYFPHLQMKYSDLLRGFRFTDNVKARKFISQIEHCLLVIPGMKKFAHGAVMWAYK